MSKKPFSLKQTLSHGYKFLSTKTLSLAVSPNVVGEVPSLASEVPTFYVLESYSRADSMLLQNELEEQGLPNALNAVRIGEVNENSAMIFLKHRRAKNRQVSPRLVRLVEICLQNPDTVIHFVPVTILWGRSPDKEDSLFKLLMADEWRVPSISKQIFNIGVMGRDTFVQFYEPKNLAKLVADGKQETGTDDKWVIAEYVQNRLKGYLNRQRTSIIGPDLSDKRNITSEILQSVAVQEAIMQKVSESGKPMYEIKDEARGYINEIASDYSYSVVRVFERFLNHLWTRLYDGVEVRHFDRVRKLAPDYQIVYVPCHRSHMDYLLLSYIIHSSGLRVPHIAAGVNLNMPVVGDILRAGGAFFLRRSFRDNPLYGAVFKEYLHSLMKRGSPIEYFIEGGRSRSGRLLAPKLGMLAMTVNSYLRSPAKPVVFIPAYISYERIMEGATYVGELKGKPKAAENPLDLLKTAKKIERIFGTVNLSFGEPLYLDKFIDKFSVDTALANAEKTNKNDEKVAENDKKINAMIENLGVKILQHINRTAVVNPVSLIALVLLSTPKAALDESHFLTQLALYQHIAQALPYDDDTAVTTMTPQEMLEYGKKLKLIETTPHLLGNVVKVADKQAPMLNYFRNNILHIFIIPSLLAGLVQRNGHIKVGVLFAVAELLYPFLQAELFLKYAKRNIKGVLEEALSVLIDTGVVVNIAGTDNDRIVASADNTSENYQKLVVLASPAQQSLERYFMALTLLSRQGSGKLDGDEVVDLCHLVSQRMAVLHSYDSPDMFDKALYRNFISALVRTEYLWADNEKNLCFDERIASVADFARLVLTPDAMHLIHQASRLTPEQISEIVKPEKRGFWNIG